MNKQKSPLIATLVALAWLVAAAASLVVLAPAPTHAQAFHSGNAQDGICACPTDFGNCMCKIAHAF